MNPLDVQKALNEGESIEKIQAELRQNNRRASDRINSWFKNISEGRHAFTGKETTEEGGLEHEAVS